MRKMVFLNGDSVEFQFNKNGLARTKLDSVCSKDIEIFRCVLKSGCIYKPELFNKYDRIQFFAFLNPTGYVLTTNRSYNIDDRAVFCPNFDFDPQIEIHSGKEDLEFYQFIGIMSEWDIGRFNWQHMVLPRFRLFREGMEYTEGFTGDAGSNLRSFSLLEGQKLGRYSMGYNYGKGPSFVGTHTHEVVEQWYFILQDSSFTYTADQGPVELNPYDITYTDRGVPHGSKATALQNINYFWVELATDGYPGVLTAELTEEDRIKMARNA
jgi:hypothetical protein